MMRKRSNTVCVKLELDGVRFEFAHRRRRRRLLLLRRQPYRVWTRFGQTANGGRRRQSRDGARAEAVPTGGGGGGDSDARLCAVGLGERVKEPARGFKDGWRVRRSGRGGGHAPRCVVGGVWLFFGSELEGGRQVDPLVRILSGLSAFTTLGHKHHEERTCILVS